MMRKPIAMAWAWASAPAIPAVLPPGRMGARGPAGERGAVTAYKVKTCSAFRPHRICGRPMGARPSARCCGRSDQRSDACAGRSRLGRPLAVDNGKWRGTRTRQARSRLASSGRKRVRERSVLRRSPWIRASVRPFHQRESRQYYPELRDLARPASGLPEAFLKR